MPEKEDTQTHFARMTVMPTQTSASILDRIDQSTTARTPFSVEFFPTRTPAAEERLWTAVRAYEQWGAAFASVTYGAGGSNRDRMMEITTRIGADTTLTPLAHLTAVNHSRAEIDDIVTTFARGGVHNILALRGDPPGNPLGIWRKHPEGVEFASELVEIIAARGDCHIGVAAFPNGHFRAPTLEADTHYTLMKYAAGAEYAITQIFFDVEAYLRLRDRLCAMDPELGSRPLIPSIMPITSLSSAHRMVELSGARLPRWLEQQLDDVAGTAQQEDTEAVTRYGCDLAIDMCNRLIAEGVPSLHFDTLNRIHPVSHVLVGTGIIDDAAYRTVLAELEEENSVPSP